MYGGIKVIHGRNVLPVHTAQPEALRKLQTESERTESLHSSFEGSETFIQLICVRTPI